MTFNDIFKSSFLENVTSFSLLDTVIALILSLVIGLFIYYIYKRTFSGVMYSQSFGVTLTALTLITTLVILAVTSNVVLSLGMVGALSIVRFRTAIKEPLDIAFLFWSIAEGIILGAGLIPLAVFGAIIVGIIITIFAKVKSGDSPYILVVKFDAPNAEDNIVSIIRGGSKRFSIKSKSLTAGCSEITYEVRLREMSTEFINKISALDGVTSAVLVSYNGDYMS